MSLTKDQIQTNDPRSKGVIPLIVPGLDGEVLIKVFSLGEQLEWEKSLLDANGKPDDKKYENLFVRLAAACVVDESRNPMFTESELMELSAKTMKAIIKKVKQVNAIGFEADKEAEKN